MIWPVAGEKPRMTYVADRDSWLCYGDAKLGYANSIDGAYFHWKSMYDHMDGDGLVSYPKDEEC